MNISIYDVQTIAEGRVPRAKREAWRHSRIEALRLPDYTFTEEVLNCVTHAVGAVLGAVIFRLVYMVALRFHMPAFMLKLVSSVIVIIAIAGPYRAGLLRFRQVRRLHLPRRRLRRGAAL